MNPDEQRESDFDDLLRRTLKASIPEQTEPEALLTDLLRRAQEQSAQPDEPHQHPPDLLPNPAHDLFSRVELPF